MAANEETAAEDAADGAAPFTIEIDLETAASIAAVGEMMHARGVAPRCSPPGLDSLLPSGSPLRLASGAQKGFSLVASRAIHRGETILRESALAWCLSRSPGSDGLFTLVDAAGRVIAALPPWAQARTLRDTLTLAPDFALRAEEAYGLLFQLSALGSRDHAAWEGMPELRVGVGVGVGVGGGGGGAPPAPAPPGEEGSPVPPRAHLLQGIFQCNAFSAALPEEDSDWKRGLLWRGVGRLQEPADRERLFDDPAPLCAVSALFMVGSLFNHTCGAPNVGYADCAWAEGDSAPCVRFVATRDIAAGEELRHSYFFSPADDASARRKKLLLTYRFRCACESCGEAVPGAGGAEDPLAEQFPYGAGVEGALRWLRGGGVYPDAESA